MGKKSQSEINCRFRKTEDRLKSTTHTRQYIKRAPEKSHFAWQFPVFKEIDWKPSSYHWYSFLASLLPWVYTHKNVPRHHWLPRYVYTLFFPNSDFQFSWNLILLNGGIKTEWVLNTLELAYDAENLCASFVVIWYLNQ